MSVARFDCRGCDMEREDDYGSYVLASDYDTTASELARLRELIDELIAAQNAVAHAVSLDATRKGTAEKRDEANLRQAKAIIALCSYRALSSAKQD